MGREAKRVPIDFDWPMKKTWGGYLMPDELEGDTCPDCANGYSQEGQWLQKVAYVLAGSADDGQEEARGRALHPWLVPLREISYGDSARRPGAKFTELVDGLVGRPAGFFGHDVGAVAEALRTAAGLPERWGVCATCSGSASIEKYPGQRDEAEAWEPTDPPSGDGWQMWETTSEGSPISPVFATPEALAEWCAIGATVFGSNTATTAEWLRIITGEDFAHVTIAPGVVVM